VSDLDPDTLETIGKNRLLRLLYILVGLRDGHTAREVGARVGMDGAEVPRAMRTLQDTYGLDAPPAKSNRRHWHLSSQGEQLAVEAERLLAHTERFTFFAQAVSQGHRGSVRLGCFNPTLKFFMAGALGDLARNPSFGYQITLSADLSYRRNYASKQLVDQLTSTLDYVIVPVSDQADLDTEFCALYEFDMVMVTEATHPLRERQAVTPAEVAESLPASAGLLLSPTEFLSRTLVDRAFQAAGVQMHVMMESPDNETRYELAREGLGIALMTTDALPSPKNGTTKWPALHMAGRPLQGQYVLTWRAGRTRRPIDDDAHQLFVQTIRSHATGFALRQGLTSPGSGNGNR